MKKQPNNYKLILFLFWGVLLSLYACTNNSQESHPHDHLEHSTKEYTCPMHPEIIRAHPGSCPICGMDLVEKKINDTNIHLYKGVHIKPIHQMVLLNTPTTTVQQKTITPSVKAKGYITYNPDNLTTIASRFSGRIDKLYVRYNFQEVRKGQKIMEIYSPELETAQQNYLFILQTQDPDPALLQAAKQKLLLLGMTDDQMHQLEQSKKVSFLVSIYAPASGHIHQMNNSEELTMPVMDMNSTDNETMNKLTIREGQYVQKGESVFSIVSLSEVWAILKIYPEDLSKIKKGQAVEIISEVAPDNPLHAKINYIEPTIEGDSKLINARVYLEKCDHHQFKIGSLVDATIQTEKETGWFIPTSSVFDLGNGHSVVFKKEGHTFRAQNVKINNRYNNLIEITEGLSPKDTIALHAGYLIDSESFVIIQ